MPEYRRLKERYSFLEMCKNPELAAEVTLLPLKKFDLDGAILFSDLLLPLEAMGLEIHYPEGEGPVVVEPVRDKGAVEALRVEGAVQRLKPVLEAARFVRQSLPPRVALIGFAGAPFTLASYAVEGGGSSSFLKVKGLMQADPEAFGLLMEKICQVIRAFLQAQVRAGCEVLQLFDSWAGALSPRDYRRWALPWTRRAIEGIGVPVIHFSTGTGGYLELVASAGGDVIGVDWRVELAEAWRRIGYDKAIQGNLDPATLVAPRSVLEEAVREVLRGVEGRPGHIFNLGHGVLPETPEANVGFLVELVHRLTERG